MDEKLKQLLLQDLCARLPYGVICHYSHKFYPNVETGDGKIRSLYLSDVLVCDYGGIVIKTTETGIAYVKPYLRSVSSMTEEEKEELLEIVEKESDIVCEQLKNNDCGIKEGKYHFNSVLELDFLLSHHFDFRGLIPLGLAIEAPEGMYK